MKKSKFCGNFPGKIEIFLTRLHDAPRFQTGLTPLNGLMIKLSIPLFHTQSRGRHREISDAYSLVRGIAYFLDNIIYKVLWRGTCLRFFYFTVFYKTARLVR